MDFKINTKELIEFLTYKVESNECTDEEYGIYIDYRKNGKKVLGYEENKYIVKKLIKDYKNYYEEGDYI